MPKKASLIRVTTVLSFLDSYWWQFWAKKVGLDECERVSKVSREFGTGVHEIIELCLTDRTCSANLFTPRQRECAQYILDWLKETKARVIDIEAKLEDKKLGLCGHCDLIAEIDGTVFIIDWKTSKKVSLTYPLQLSAYAHMASKQLKMPIDNGVIVRVPNDPKADPQFEVTQYRELKKYFKIFSAGLVFYKYMTGKVKI